MSERHIEIELLEAKGYRMERFESHGLVHFRWRFENQRGGGYLTEGEAWNSAALHCRLTAERSSTRH